MSRQRTCAAIVAVSLLVAVGGVAGAAAIPINNYSFESPVVNPNQWLQPPTGWTLVGNFFGVFRGNGEFGQNAAPTDGNQIVFFNVSSADGTQNLGSTYQAGMDYVMSIDIAARIPYGVAQDMDLILYAAGNPNNIVKSRTLTGLDVTADVFNTYMMTATAADVAAAGAVGQTIGIRFAGNGGTAGDWLWDLNDGTVEAMLRYGASRETLYCPANELLWHDDFWLDGVFGGYIVSGYCWLIRHPGPGGALAGGPAMLNDQRWQQTLAGADGAAPVAFDPVVRAWWLDRWTDFGHRLAGATSHMDAREPAGGNILHMDAHVRWKRFDDMTFNARFGPDTYW